MSLAVCKLTRMLSELHALPVARYRTVLLAIAAVLFVFALDVTQGMVSHLESNLYLFLNKYKKIEVFI